MNDEWASAALSDNTQFEPTPTVQLDHGWIFDSGFVSFGGTRYPITSLPAAMLGLFLDAKKMLLTRKELYGAWPEGDRGIATRDAVHQHLGTLRNVLRTVARDIRAEQYIQDDPLPLEGKARWKFLLPRG